MKASYDYLANFVGFQAGVQIRLYWLTQTRGKSPKPLPSWKYPYKGITQISGVVFRIQQHPRLKIMVVRFSRLLPYLRAA
jgi:hypothetical protein